MNSTARRIIGTTLLVLAIIFLLAINTGVRAQEPPTAEVYGDHPVLTAIMESTLLTQTTCDPYSLGAWLVTSDTYSGALDRVNCARVHESFADWLDRYTVWVRGYPGVVTTGRWRVADPDTEGRAYTGGFVGTDGYMYIITIQQAHNTPDTGSVTISRVASESTGAAR